MKKYLAIFFVLGLFLFSNPTSLQAQICGDVTLSSQAEVDSFDCTSVTGNFIISGSGITNLDGLSELTSVEGQFRIYDNASLTNIDGLSALTSVEDRLHFINNDALTNVDGLSALTSVGQDFFIYDNASLTNIDGLSALTSVGSDLRIGDNDALTNVDGLSALTSIRTDLAIGNNDALTNVDGLSALTWVGAELRFQNNDALTNIDGLSALTSGSDEGDIIDSVTIYYNPALTNIDGLSGLTSVWLGVSISNNAALTNVDGLSALTSIIDGGLYIRQNASLDNIDGLAALTSVGDMWIENNGSLGRCCGLYPLLVYGAVDDITIENNAVGCNSPEDITDSGVCPELITIIDYFDARVADGSLTGYGSGNSANGRLYALRNMLEMAGDLIAINDIDGACGQLRAALGKCDSESPPADFVTGSAAPGLCAMISDLMLELGCK